MNIHNVDQIKRIIENDRKRILDMRDEIENMLVGFDYIDRFLEAIDPDKQEDAA
jgi:hypothetical protein